MTDHDRFMAEALAEGRKAEAAGNRPTGAVIVRDGEIIGRGHNTVASGGDPLAHAEVAAIHDVSRRTGASSLVGTTLYCSMESCPMCLWAVRVAGIRRLVLGGRHAGVGRPDLGDYAAEKLLAMTGNPFELVTGVRQAECEDIRRRWNAAHGADAGARPSP